MLRVVLALHLHHLPLELVVWLLFSPNVCPIEPLAFHVGDVHLSRSNTHPQVQRRDVRLDAGTPSRQEFLQAVVRDAPADAQHVPALAGWDVDANRAVEIVVVFCGNTMGDVFVAEKVLVKQAR